MKPDRRLEAQAGPKLRSCSHVADHRVVSIDMLDRRPKAIRLLRLPILIDLDLGVVIESDGLARARARTRVSVHRVHLSGGRARANAPECPRCPPPSADTLNVKALQAV
jgi:hypothetical protein